MNDVGPVLERWIDRTQGETAEIRSVRKPALLWAITKFDIRVQDKLNTTEENLKISWGSDGLLKQTILERFGHYDWFKNWSNNQPFNNVFLVRKPGWEVPFLEIENQQELSIVESKRAQLDLMKRTFAMDADIQKHVSEPEVKWDAMLELNDGGMKYISDYLETISSPEVKHNRIIEQLNQAIQLVEQRFASWYQSDGAEEVIRKRALAQEIIKELQSRSLLLGELLRLLQLPQETVFSLYHSADLDETEGESAVENQAEIPSPAFDMSFDFGGGEIDLFGEPPAVDPIVADTPSTVVNELKSRFAQAVFKAWIEHLRSISADEHLMRFFKFTPESKKTIDNMVGELITAAMRLKLQSSIAEAVLKNEQAGYKRDQVAERQVFTVHTYIADFLAWLGFITLPASQRPASRAVAGCGVFESKTVETLNGLPKLSEHTGAYTKNYLFDWFVSFAAVCEQNAGHSAGREIDATQNAKLGDVLRQFTTSKITN